MVQHRYDADIAMTPDGNFLAMVHQQILFFETFDDLNEYFNRLNARWNLVASMIVPLDDQQEGATDDNVVESVERWLGSLIKNSAMTSGREETPPPRNSHVEDLGIREVLGEFLKEAGWVFDVDEGQTFKVNVKGRNGNWVAHALPFDTEDQALFISICPVQVPVLKRPSMAEFITRANFGLKIGNFEMGYEHGDVRYKTSIDVEGDRLVGPLVHQLVTANLQMMDRYLPGIRRVIETDIAPKEAINLVENGSIPWQ